ncbi:MAG TPA: aminotransferase class I/II-fold pyridoxal phosphate-dependent enzyme [Terriglobales bacterium]|nr:aminotransferase class I/II-fold pyridoxal phosphate-dependent enzyme [Terriglobales bacterium]
MLNLATDAFRDSAWEPAALRRLGRAFSDLAVAELTQSGSGPVRPPEFLRRARRALASPLAAQSAAAWTAALGRASLRVNHPCFMAQQIAAPVPLAALAETWVGAMNQSIAVHDMSPAGTLVDRAVIARFKRLVGFPAAAEGSLVPGGSFANLTALLAARAASSGKLAILAGAQTHYSIARAASIMGLGPQSVFSIPSDALHRTDPAGVAPAARAARRAGFRRFVLVGTAGSTPTGSFDDLEALARAARALRAWFHVDAAHGGGMAFSPRLRKLLRGLERADSVAFDPHKMMFMPLAAGCVLVRSGRRLRAAFEQDAPYLFHRRTPSQAAPGDVGPFTIACSQRFDALKIWLVWQAYGPRFFAALAEGVCATAQAAYDYCAASSVLVPLHRPGSNILCFALRNPPRSIAAADRRHAALKEAVNASGRAYISSTVLDTGAGPRRCLRIVVMNPRSRPEHARRVLRAVEALAEKPMA